jgi:hypothetical protein
MLQLGSQSVGVLALTMGMLHGDQTTHWRIGHSQQGEVLEYYEIVSTYSCLVATVATRYHMEESR